MKDDILSWKAGCTHLDAMEIPQNARTAQLAALLTAVIR
jgi:hypothetical protein